MNDNTLKLTHYSIYKNRVKRRDSGALKKDGWRQRLRNLVLFQDEPAHICKKCRSDMIHIKGQGLVCTELCGCNTCLGACKNINHITKWFKVIK